MLGLSTVFNTGYICRFCYATHLLIQNQNDFEERTDKKWKDDLLNAWHLKTGVRGVIGNPFFSDSLGDHVDLTEICPFDLLHVFCLGIFDKFFPDLLGKIVNQDPEREKQLLASISNFKFWKDGYSSVRVVDGQYHVYGTGQQVIFCSKTNLLKCISLKKLDLFISLPELAISMPKGRLWDCYILLREIMMIAFSPYLNEEMIQIEKNKIREFLKEYLIYAKQTGTSIIPKIHYLIHLPIIQKKFGPLFRFNTLRFERMNGWLKKCALKFSNWR